MRFNTWCRVPDLRRGRRYAKALRLGPARECTDLTWVRLWPFGQLPVVLSALVVLALIAPVGTAQTPASSQSPIVERLKKNAEEFQYTIGKQGGSLTLSTIAGPKTFNLAISTETSSTVVLNYLFEGLTRTSWLTNEVEPELAASWTHSDDGLTWTFRLRKDVRWHDGTPFTAHDVDFTFNQIIYNETIPASARPGFNFRRFDEESGSWKEAKMTVKALDDYTVECVLPVPFAPFLQSMGTPIYPKHILEKHVNDGSFTSTWNVSTAPAKIIGTGPFTIERYEVGERVILKRNPRYWLKDAEGHQLPYLEKIIFLIVPSQATALLKFQARETDIYSVTGEHFPILKPQEKEGNFTIHKQGPDFGTTFLAFNMNPGKNSDTDRPYLAPEKLNWFRNKAFRQALAHGIDKDSIINNVMNGLGYPQWSSISPAAGDFHNPNVRHYDYNIDQANEMLDNIGWVDTDGDGIREDDEGNPIAFSLVTNAGNIVREKVCTMIKQDLKKAGIEVHYKPLEFNALVSQLTSTYDWETIVIGFTGGTEPHHGINFWHTSERLHLWYPYQPQPATEWEAEINDLYIKGSQELNHDARLKYYHRAQAIAAEHVPVIYTVLSERLTAVRNVFGNMTPTLYALWDVRYLYRHAL
jgi:peptide/nickel transport system substrate-binding protein